MKKIEVNVPTVTVTVTVSLTGVQNRADLVWQYVQIGIYGGENTGKIPVEGDSVVHVVGTNMNYITVGGKGFSHWHWINGGIPENTHYAFILKKDGQYETTVTTV